MSKSWTAAGGGAPSTIRRALFGFAIGVSIAASLSGSVLAQSRSTSGTVEFKGGAVAVGIGYSWGGGTVTYDGKTYPISVSGLSALDVGASKYSATGTVTNLKQIKDIEGTYVAGEVGATVAGGVSASSMRNDKGVVIKFETTRAGLQFTIAPKGATIKLK